jgi:uncharacterized protein YndB with AHSA1/START domain
MEPIESRSDSRRRLIPCTPAQVFDAIRDPARLARWWGPDGFTSTIHRFDFEPGGEWLLTMHGPDGKDHPNHSRFTRIETDRLFEIEHLNGHRFRLTIELVPVEGGTEVRWRQAFDTVEHYERIARFVASANEQNLDRLAAEVRRVNQAALRPSGTGLQAIGALAVGAAALGAIAIGAIAVGRLAVCRLAIGRLAIGRAAVGRARIPRLEIDELVVARLRITDELEVPRPPEPKA